MIFNAMELLQVQRKGPSSHWNLFLYFRISKKEQPKVTDLIPWNKVIFGKLLLGWT